jgi:dipeptidyl aminopeptidase/acylaminoacyl peptidase
MTRLHPFSRPAVLTALVCFAVAAAAADRRPIAETDIHAFQWLANAKISPDGSRIVYVRVAVNAKRDNYDTALWMVPSAGVTPRQLTSGPRDSSPQWSPNGQTLAFVRVAEKDGKPQPPQVYLLAMDGGEARPLTDLPKGASGPIWSPDCLSIAFSSTNVPADFDKKKDADEKSDVKVITKAVYRMNGAGYLEPDRPTHIWTVLVPTTPGEAQKAKQVTSGAFSENDMVWSRDSSQIYFT